MSDADRWYEGKQLFIDGHACVIERRAMYRCRSCGRETMTGLCGCPARDSMLVREVLFAVPEPIEVPE